MTPDQIKAGHTYEMKSETCWTVKSFVGSGGSIIITDGEVTLYDTPHNFAAYAVRDITPAPESDQGKKVAQAQSQGASRGDGAERLPCPWCGGSDTGITYNTVECSTCGAEGPPVMDGDDERMPTNAEVIAAWNRRALPAAASEVVRKFASDVAEYLYDAGHRDDGPEGSSGTRLLRQAREIAQQADAPPAADAVNAELLDSLKSLAELVRSVEPGVSERIDRARAAIARAEAGE